VIEASVHFWEFMILILVFLGSYSNLFFISSC